MLDSKKRILILIIGMLVFAVPAIINQVFILVNSPLNPTDINLWQTETEIVYSYNDGDKDSKDKELSFEISHKNDIAEVKGNVDDNKFNFEVDKDSGHYIDGGDETKKYTIFYIPVENPMLTAGDFEKEDEYDVVDPIGLIGFAGQEFTLIVGEKKVYWDTSPQMKGAQFSFVIHLYDENDTKVAEGLMDSTAGFLEILQGGPTNNRIEIIDPGAYMVSRNRDNMMLFALIIGIPLPFVIYILLVKKFEWDQEEAEEFAELSALAAIVSIVDIDYDVWFYSVGGEDMWYALHFIMLGVFALVCLRQKYGLKYIFPAFLEIAFIFAMTTFVGDFYAPHITAFMGLYMSYLAILFRSGINKRDYDDKLDILI
ncbi:MAG: hypothetical protein ACTSR8_06605 [Promethearchaeota archaeon]